MEFLARHYEDILPDYSFIRAIGVQIWAGRMKKKKVWLSHSPRLARRMPFNN